MDLLDAQRLVSSLTALRLWLEGTANSPGAVQRIDALKDSLESLTKELDLKSKEQLPAMKDVLRGTTESVLILQFDRITSELERIIKESNEEIPNKVARIVLASIQGSTAFEHISHLDSDAEWGQLNVEKKLLVKRVKDQSYIIKLLCLISLGLVFVCSTLVIGLIF